MEAARASTAGHLSPAWRALSEVQTAYAIGRGMMGFALLTASFSSSLFTF
jgi:hypothetical protein